MKKIQQSGLTLERGKEGQREKERKKRAADRSCVPSATASCAVYKFILWTGSMTKAIGIALNKSHWARLTVQKIIIKKLSKWSNIPIKDGVWGWDQENKRKYQGPLLLYLISQGMWATTSPSLLRLQ